MENALNQIVATGVEIAIFVLTAVPTVDTRGSIPSVSAARLTGADCIMSGIRPQIAQTDCALGPSAPCGASVMDAKMAAANPARLRPRSAS